MFCIWCPGSCPGHHFGDGKLRSGRGWVLPLSPFLPPPVGNQTACDDCKYDQQRANAGSSANASFGACAEAGMSPTILVIFGTRESKCKDPMKLMCQLRELSICQGLLKASAKEKRTTFYLVTISTRNRARGWGRDKRWNLKTY